MTDDPLAPIRARYADGFDDIEQAAEDVGTLISLLVEARQKRTRTPGTALVDAVCPSCGVIESMILAIGTEHVVSDDGSELRLKAKSKALSHNCGAGQITFEDLERQYPTGAQPEPEGEPLQLESGEQPIATCPICRGVKTLDLPDGWQNSGAAIEIIECGNPWHYRRPDGSRMSSQDADADELHGPA